MVFLCLKIPEAGKQVQRNVKVIDETQFTHVVHKKMQVFLLKLLGIFDVLFRKVYTRYVIAFFIQVYGMPAPAAGNVQYPRFGCWL